MYYPVNLNVRGKKCLVVGGGKVAFQKVKGLLRGGALLTVIAPRLEEALEKFIRQGKIRPIREPFKARYLSGFFLAVVATDDREKNSQIAALCRKKRVLVNVVDQPADCTFTVPSIFRRGPLTIAISTDGASPALSKKIRKDLEERYGNEFGALTRLMAQVRKRAIAEIPSFRLRKRRFEKVIGSNILSLLRKGRAKEAEKRIWEILNGGRL